RTAAPFAVSFETSWCCAASAASVKRRSSESLATPPAAATCEASEGARRTTRTRWPIATGGRGVPTRPRHAAAVPGLDASPRVGLLCDETTKAAAPRPARTRIVAGLSRRIRVEREVGGRLERGREARGGGDHRRVVGAERERREGGARERRTELGVGRD